MTLEDQKKLATSLGWIDLVVVDGILYGIRPSEAHNLHSDRFPYRFLDVLRTEGKKV
jgi:hypothetical protein